MKGRKQQDDWYDDWDDDWNDDWDDEPASTSLVQQFMDWSGLSNLFGKKQSAEEAAFDPDDDLDKASRSSTRDSAAWSHAYWQRMLAIVFFAIGLILILRLAVLSI